MSFLNTQQGLINFSSQTGPALNFLGNGSTIPNQTLFPSSANVGKLLTILSPTQWGLTGVPIVPLTTSSSTALSATANSRYNLVATTTTAVTLPLSSALTAGDIFTFSVSAPLTNILLNANQVFMFANQNGSAPSFSVTISTGTAIAAFCNSPGSSFIITYLGSTPQAPSGNTVFTLTGGAVTYNT